MKFYDRHLCRLISHILPAALILSLSALAPRSAFGAITPDATSSTSGNTDVLSWSHTVGAGPNRILIVGVSNRRSNRTVTSVTYAGQNLTRVGTQLSGTNTCRLDMWYLVSPPAGTATVVVTLSNGTDVIGGAVSFFGVDPLAPMGPFTSANGTGTNAALSVASDINEIVVDVVAAPGTALSLTPNAAQTPHWIIGTGNGGANVRGASSRLNGAPSVTMSWTLGASTDWAIGAVALKPAPNPNLVLTLVQNDGTPPPGTTVTYTINYTNTGDGLAGSTIITVPVPVNTSIVPNSVILNGVGKTDAPGDDEVTLSGSTISIDLGAVPASATGTVTYEVIIQ